LTIPQIASKNSTAIPQPPKSWVKQKSSIPMRSLKHPQFCQSQIPKKGGEKHPEF
jgi:hypothetical protein